MIRIYNILKILFYIGNLVLIFFYLFPGSLLGWFIYGDLKKQPQISIDFLYVSSNHFYTFFLLSALGFISYLRDKKLKFIVKYLFLISFILEISHIFISERSFQFADLFGNVLGVITVVVIYKFWKK